MFKQICMFRKRDDISMEDFIDYYGNKHAPLLAPMMPQALRYVRRFVQPEQGMAFGESPAVPFDCLMELWWKSREEFESCMACWAKAASSNKSMRTRRTSSRVTTTR